MSRCWRGTVCRAPPPCFQVRPSLLLHLRCSSFILLCRFGGASMNLDKPLPPLPPPQQPVRPLQPPGVVHPPPKFLYESPPTLFQPPSLAFLPQSPSSVHQSQRLQQPVPQSAEPYWKLSLYPHMPVQRELLERVDKRIKLAARAYVRELLTTPMDDLD